jgi:hypothetical protein
MKHKLKKLSIIIYKKLQRGEEVDNLVSKYFKLMSVGVKE